MFNHEDHSDYNSIQIIVVFNGVREIIINYSVHIKLNESNCKNINYVEKLNIQHSLLPINKYVLIINY